MSPLVPNWPALIIILILVLLLGLIAIISPITLLKLSISWPTRFVNSRALTDNDLPAKLRDAVYLLDNNPEKFRERFWHAVLFMRGMGCLMLIMVLFTILVLALALTTG